MEDMIRVIGAGGHGQVVADILGEVIFHDRGHEYKAFDKSAIVAIGNNAIRKSIFEKLQFPVNVIHESVIIGGNVEIGRGVVICAGVIINTGAKIGDNVILNTGCSIDHHCIIGSHAHIAPNAVLCGNVTVGEGALVGANSTCVPGAEVGAWTLVKAGSLVK